MTVNGLNEGSVQPVMFWIGLDWTAYLVRESLEPMAITLGSLKIVQKENSGEK